MTEVYNPLSKLNLGKSVAEALLDREPYALGELPVFDGAGIYAIYYNGAHEAYGQLAEANDAAWNVPIYIGKAIPSGGRRGRSIFTELKGRFVHSRLSEHAESIRMAEDLDIEDFVARWLIVDDIWIPLGETLLISKFQPVWNVLLDGFGNHDPGSGRYQGMRPMWDVVHPGRRWAPKLKDRTDTREELVDRVKAYLDEQEFEEDPRISFAPKT